MPWSQGTRPVPDMGSCALRLSQPPEHWQFLADPTLTWHILQGVQKRHSSQLTFGEEFAAYLHLSLPTHVQKQLKKGTNLQLLADSISMSHSLNHKEKPLRFVSIKSEGILQVQRSKALRTYI